ncbi:hypothetical protein EIP91_007171 [Steccherinum ochraceum]|uniref:Uncharacterized protein n=1 Tax=Steccherinum ochraceum TaxID=92696 RepID=A0A4V2MXB8_9APHY|nr:hypothetical protein EIP91_007171 [Steccherinum ochraceum]
MTGAAKFHSPEDRERLSSAALTYDLALKVVLLSQSSHPYQAYNRELYFGVGILNCVHDGVAESRMPRSRIQSIGFTSTLHFAFAWWYRMANTRTANLNRTPHAILLYMSGHILPTPNLQFTRPLTLPVRPLKIKAFTLYLTLITNVLEGPAEQLEELATRYFKLKWSIRQHDVAVEYLQAHQWMSPPIRDASQLPTPHMIKHWPTRQQQEEYYRTSVWISPGFLIMGSLVRPIGVSSEFGYVTLWDLGRGDRAVVPGGLPLTEYKIPSLSGSAADLTVSKEPLPGEPNAYLLLVGTWTRTQWALLRIQLPLVPCEPAVCEEIAAFSVSQNNRKTAAAMDGDVIVLLNDIAQSLPSILVWNWREGYLKRFRMHSLFDHKASSDGTGPVHIAPPYIVYIRSHTHTIHILRIPDLSAMDPFDGFDHTARARTITNCWSARLPWPQTANGGFQLTTTRNGLPIGTGDEGIVTVDIHYCKPGFFGSAALVISEGSSTQETRRGHPPATFPFQAQILKDEPDDPQADIVIGVTSIPGSAGWLHPKELDILLRRVIKVRAEPDNTVDDERRRVPVGRAELQTRVAIDPVMDTHRRR